MAMIWIHLESNPKVIKAVSTLQIANDYIEATHVYTCL